MNMIHKITLDLMQQQEMPRIQVRQGDAYSRTVEITLTAEGKPWNVPVDARVLIRFRAHDILTGESAEGIYDTLEDGSGWSVSGNVVTVGLAPQMLAEQALVQADLLLMRGEAMLATGMFEIYVNQVAVNDMVPRLADYYNIQSQRDAGKVDVLLDTTTGKEVSAVSAAVGTGKVYARIAVMCETVGTASNQSAVDLVVLIDGMEAGCVYEGVGAAAGEAVWADVSVFSGGHCLAACCGGGQGASANPVFSRHNVDLSQPVSTIRVQTRGGNGYFGAGSHIRILGIRA